MWATEYLKLKSKVPRQSLKASRTSPARDYRPLFQNIDPVTARLRDSLFQEPLEEPSNILFTTRVDDETVRYEAMEAAFWREYLELLEREVAGE